MLCGTVNTYRNETVDLTDRPNLHYLNVRPLHGVFHRQYVIRTYRPPAECCTFNAAACSAVPAAGPEQLRRSPGLRRQGAPSLMSAQCMHLARGEAC
jgi:hypothetical protein